MEYTIVKNGEVIELPKYSMKIAGELEAVDLLNQKVSEPFKSKCKKMYEFCSSLIGKEKVADLIGKFEESDPNEINVLYLNIVNCYNKPIEEYTQASASEKMNSMEVDKMIELLNAIGKSDKVFKVK